jgi:uncharacterized integral membrane protein
MAMREPEMSDQDLLRAPQDDVSVPEQGTSGVGPLAGAGGNRDTSGSASTAGVEGSGARLGRHAHRVRLYALALLSVAVISYVAVLASLNTDHVRLDWAFATSSVPVVWVILIALVSGGFIGVLMAAIFHWRTRRPNADS